MSTPDFYALMTPSAPKQETASNDFYSIAEKGNLVKPQKGKAEKAGRVGAQYGLGRLDVAALPYTLAAQLQGSEGYQKAEYRGQLLDELERLADLKRMGQWDEQDEKNLQEIQRQLQSPEETPAHIKPYDITPSGLAKKGVKEATGYNLQPEGAAEHIAEFAGAFTPKEIAKIATSPAKIPGLLNKEKRAAIKLEKQWKNLERAAASNVEKETLLNFAKSHGLTPEETNLLFHSKGNAKALESTAKKTKKFKGVVRGLKDKLGANYEELKELGRNGGYLSLREAESLTDDLGKIVTDIEKTFVEGGDTKSARLAIQDAIERINNRGGTVEELINSRQGLKEGLNWKNIDRGDSILAQADKAFMDAIQKKNPAVYQRLVDTDRAYAKYKQFSNVLRDKAPEFKFKGIALPPAVGPVLAYGLTYLFGGLKGVVGKEAVQRLSTEIAINPAFRGPVKKFQNALLSGSKKSQKQVFSVIKQTVREQDPELYAEIKDLSID